MALPVNVTLFVPSPIVNDGLAALVLDNVPIEPLSFAHLFNVYPVEYVGTK